MLAKLTRQERQAVQLITGLLALGLLGLWLL